MTEHDHDWVFAYGSNMDLTDLARWLREKGEPPSSPHEVRVATLPAHRLVWNYRSVARRGGAANIEPSKDDLPGIVLRVGPSLLRAIDRKEGATYGREPHHVHTQEGTLQAWVYRVVEEHRQPTPVYPRRAYLDIVLRAARTHALPSWHIDAVAATPTLD